MRGFGNWSPRAPSRRLVHALPGRSPPQPPSVPWFAVTEGEVPAEMPKNPDLVEFGRRVREARLAAGLTLQAVAQKSDLNWSYVAGCERGERNCTLRNLLRIARALGVPAGDLVP